MKTSLITVRRATAFFHQQVENTGLCTTIADSFVWIENLCGLIDDYATVPRMSDEQMQSYAVSFAAKFVSLHFQSLSCVRQLMVGIDLAKMLLQSRAAFSPSVDLELVYAARQSTLCLN